MFSKMTLIAAAIAIAALTSIPAQAGIDINGLNPNGLNPNGLNPNAIGGNALSTGSTSLNGSVVAISF